MATAKNKTLKKNPIGYKTLDLDFNKASKILAGIAKNTDDIIEHNIL